LLLASESLALIWLIERLASQDWVQSACLGQFILAMAAASGALYCRSKRRRGLYQPKGQLEQLLPEVRAGRLPIDELSAVRGEMAPIAKHIQEILRELRAQKAMVTEMDHDVRQRIANRTEALERKIGTLTHQASRDPLTGLFNRRGLNEHLGKAIERAAKGGALSVLMMDVDNFKPLNDTLGHAAGDELLRSIGQILRSTLRENDLAFRCGGDEFVIVLEGCDEPAAIALANRVMELMDALAKTVKVVNPPRLSIGVAALDRKSAQTPEALLEAADKRLYAVKGERKRGISPDAKGPKPALRKTA
jgi:diguanylate cyclase (GGDEF)-like protein